MKKALTVGRTLTTEQQAVYNTNGGFQGHGVSKAVAAGHALASKGLGERGRRQETCARGRASQAAARRKKAKHLWRTCSAWVSPGKV